MRNPSHEAQTLATLPTGKIEIVFNGIFSRLEFNCSCEDALPYCRAMCCRMRTHSGVSLEKDEQERFHHMAHPGISGLRILQHNAGDDSCIYLTKDSLCSVHEDKPKACRAFHCSPNGVGDNLTVRGRGWMILPTSSGV